MERSAHVARAGQAGRWREKIPPALLLPDPTVNSLRTHHLFPLHPPFVFLLGQLPSVPMVATHIAVPANLTAHRACTDSNHFLYLPQAHLRLQQHLYCISLLPRQMLVSHPLSLFCYDSKVILSGFKALHFRVESSPSVSL